jgi:hypothetical protein
VVVHTDERKMVVVVIVQNPSFLAAFFGIGGRAQVGGGAGGGPSTRCGILLRLSSACLLTSAGLRRLFEEVGTGGRGIEGGGAKGGSWIIGGLGGGRSGTNGSMLALLAIRGGKESALPCPYMSMEE